MRDDANLLDQTMDFSVFQYAYALSGGIGSGKSVACEIIASFGYPIIDADQIAHQALREKTLEIVEVFGEAILENGEISRPALGKIVFNDQAQLKILESILSPEIQKKIFALCVDYEAKRKPYFIEIPLLFEQRERYNFSYCILIVCSKEMQIRRIMQRNHIKENEAKQRISLQMPLEQKIPLASKVFENMSSKEELREKIKQWINERFATLL